MAKTHWKKLTNPDYLGAYAFEPGEEKTATVDYVRVEAVTGSDGRKEDCMVMYFKDRIKPLILNVTNSKMITKVLQTPYIEDWANKRLVLGVETVSAFGQRTEAVRVKDKKAAVPQALKCELCGCEIVGKDNFTAEQIIRASEAKFNKALCLDCATKEGSK